MSLLRITPLVVQLLLHTDTSHIYALSSIALHTFQHSTHYTAQSVCKPHPFHILHLLPLAIPGTGITSGSTSSNDLRFRAASVRLRFSMLKKSNDSDFLCSKSQMTHIFYAQKVKWLTFSMLRKSNDFLCDYLHVGIQTSSHSW